MIVTLFITSIIEGVIVIGYCLWGKKAVKPILLTSIGGSLITQSFLWIVLNLFFQTYLVTLLIAEILIWIFESLLLVSIPATRLSFKEAVLLSLGMNLSSFVLGLFLPV